uniref:Uncharacterized protein n=1 Tax=Romanomermis culicivorax TaxID=13658 RepID=A0A915I3C4_ROMCU
MGISASIGQWIITGRNRRFLQARLNLAAAVEFVRRFTAVVRGIFDKLTITGRTNNDHKRHCNSISLLRSCFELCIRFELLDPWKPESLDCAPTGRSLLIGGDSTVDLT